jgi:hypothetical protein
MYPRNDQQFIHAQIITRFLQGETLGFVAKVRKVTSAEIYARSFCNSACDMSLTWKGPFG